MTLTFPKGRMHGKISNVLRSTHWTGSQRVGRRKMRDEKKKKREVEELDLTVIQRLKEPEAMKMTNAFELRKEISWSFRGQT